MARLELPCDFKSPSQPRERAFSKSMQIVRFERGWMGFVRTLANGRKKERKRDGGS